MAKETEKSPQEILEEMKGKKWIYKNEFLELLGYSFGSGESGLEVEIYTNRGTVYTDKFRVSEKLKEFTPTQELTMAIIREERKKQTTLTTEAVNELRETVLDQIRKLKENPDAATIQQSKAINESITAITNLARTELEYRRHYEKLTSRK